MTLRAGAYRNPLEWLLSQEARTCAGCIWQLQLRRGDKDQMFCTKGKKHGNRCKQYQEESHADTKAS